MWKVGMIAWMGVSGWIGLAQANEWRVDKKGGSNFATIQEAIDGAADGDVIWVGDGTWTGDGNRDIDFRGKAIRVRSANGPERCVIDCGGGVAEPHFGFIFQAGEGRDSVVEGFTIINGWHEEAGAIVCSYGTIQNAKAANPTIWRCVIRNNFGKKAGALYSYSLCGPRIAECVIANNLSEQVGGIHFSDECSPEVISCRIYGNQGEFVGGIRTGGARCRGTVANSVICGNGSEWGTEASGIEWWAYGGSLTLTNCTIVNNMGGPGVLIGGGGDPTGTITNCIVWGNTGNEWNDGQLYFWQMNPTITHCDIQGGWTGPGNIDADSLFVDAYGSDGGQGTMDDDLRLIGGSPCLDAGDNAAVPDWMTIDAGGDQRIQNGVVDIGAYEGQHQGLAVTPKDLTILEGQTASFTIRLGTDPYETIEVEVLVATGDGDIQITSPKILHFDSSNFDQPQTVSLAAGEDSDCYGGLTIFMVRATEFVSVQVRAVEIDNDSILYVDTNQDGNGGGADWANAFATLQEALTTARNVPGIHEIRVAQGTYQPDDGNTATPGDRKASFELIDGVVLKGGYAGTGAPNPDQRDIQRYETILSGDLNFDDTAGPADPNWVTDESRGENSYHVVFANHPIEGTEIDGFTIVSGNSNGEGFITLDQHGGGLVFIGGELTIRRCRFERNSAIWGGGLAFAGGSPVVEDCVFVNNAAQNHGGAMMSEESSIRKVRGCRFAANVAGMMGGAVWNFDDNPAYVNCLFEGNRAGDGGGAVWQVDNGDYRFIQCTFVGNRTDGDGGALYCTEWPYLSGCIFWDNPDKTGSGEQSHVYHWFEPMAFRYSCVQGWTGTLSGPGNIGDDPMFVNAAGGDYHLKSQAGRWDPVDKAWVQDIVTSPCVDAGDPAALIGLEPFPDGGVVNMGADGGTSEASKSYFGKPVCEVIVAGDINGDCKVDLGDFAILAGHWLEANSS